jgi:hypothetical protein
VTPTFSAIELRQGDVAIRLPIHFTCNQFTVLLIIFEFVVNILASWNEKSPKIRPVSLKLHNLIHPDIRFTNKKM